MVHAVLFDANFFIMGFQTFPDRFQMIVEELERRNMVAATTQVVLKELRRLYLMKAIGKMLQVLDVSLVAAKELRDVVFAQWGRAPKAVEDLTLPMAGARFASATVITTDKLLEETINHFLSRRASYKNVTAQPPGAWMMILADSSKDPAVRADLKPLAYEFWEKEITYAVSQKSFGRIQDAIEQMLSKARELPSEVSDVVQLTPFQEELWNFRNALNAISESEDVHARLDRFTSLLSLAYIESGGILTQQITEQCIPQFMSKLIEVAIQCMVQGRFPEAMEYLNQSLALSPLFHQKMRQVTGHIGLLKVIVQMATTEFQNAQETLDALKTSPAFDQLTQTYSALDCLNCGFLARPNRTPCMITQADMELILDIVEEIAPLSPQLATEGLVAILGEMAETSEVAAKFLAEKMLTKLFLQEVLKMVSNIQLLAQVKSFAEAHPNLRLLNQCVSDPAGTGSTTFQPTGTYQELSQLPEGLREWLDILSCFKTEGKFGLATVLVCRAWSLGCNVAVYDSGNSIPENVDEYWKIRLDSGRYKVERSKYPEQSSLILFPSLNSSIIGESSRGLRTVMNFVTGTDV